MSNFAQLSDERVNVAIVLREPLGEVLFRTAGDAGQQVDSAQQQVDLVRRQADRSHLCSDKNLFQHMRDSLGRYDVHDAGGSLQRMSGSQKRLDERCIERITFQRHQAFVQHRRLADHFLAKHLQQRRNSD